MYRCWQIYVEMKTSASELQKTTVCVHDQSRVITLPKSTIRVYIMRQHSSLSLRHHLLHFHQQHIALSPKLPLPVDSTFSGFRHGALHFLPLLNLPLPLAMALFYVPSSSLLCLFPRICLCVLFAEWLKFRFALA